MSRFVRTFRSRKIFLDCLAAGDSVSKAAMAAGATTSIMKRWRAEDPNFAADWDEAIEDGTDFIEDVATERALKKSDPLMLAILKARRPEKFDRANKLELSGGIDVTGSRARLLNKIARLQAEGNISTGGNQEEPEVLEAQAPEAVKLLPSPEPGGVHERGRKRRAVEQGNRRQAAS
jgi:ClpP class serine protease